MRSRPALRPTNEASIAQWMRWRWLRCWLELVRGGVAQGAYNDEPAQAATAVPAPPPPFATGCALCHGKDAKGTPLAPGLANSAHVQALSDADISKIIMKGKGKMPPVFRCRRGCGDGDQVPAGINPPVECAPAAAPAPNRG